MSSSREIPTSSREALRKRDDRCVRCWARYRPLQWHHRRSRSIRDEHTHHPGNGVLLCHDCHTWAHKNPAEARDLGLIVSRYEPNPCSIPWQGLICTYQPDCDGSLKSI